MALMAVLESDLRALSAEARRRYPAVKDAAEHGIIKLRTLQTPSDIAANEDILRIFLTACEVRTVKLSVIALSCLQKLLSHDAVTSSALSEIVSTLKDHAEMVDDSVQLKTLQTVMLIFQSRLHPESEDTVAQALNICFRLLENPRSSDRVRNTAAATFRQAVALIFDKVVSAESLPKFGSLSRTSSIASGISRKTTLIESLDIGGGSSYTRETLSSGGKVGFRLLEDLAALAAGGSATWLRVGSLQRNFALDILEFVLSSYVVAFTLLLPYKEVLRHQICSLLMTSIRSTAVHEVEVGEHSFRRLVLRLIAHIIRLYSSSLAAECEVFLSILMKITFLDLPLWHRILVLEMLRGFCVEARTLRILFENFDMNPKNTNIVEDIVKALARVLSSVQVLESSEESLAAVAGIFSNKAKGIERSLDNDASNAAVLVASEAHAVTLAVEGILGVVFTVATLTDEAVEIGEIESPRSDTDPPPNRTGKIAVLCFSMVDAMWLTILDALSFILSRSQGEAIVLEILKGYQAFTQACGILRAVEPLNSFLASLCKFTINIPVEAEKRSPLQSAASKRSEPLVDQREIVLTPTNVQALRTLFNIAHRLNNVLGPSWVLVLETLAALDRTIHSPHAATQEISTSATTLSKESSSQSCDLYILSSLNSQLFESSALMHIHAVKSLLSALCQLSHQCMSDTSSGIGPGTTQKIGNINFSVKRMISVLVSNVHRVEPLWDQVIGHFIELANNPNQDLRKMALDALDESICAVLASDHFLDNRLCESADNKTVTSPDLKSLEYSVIYPLKLLYFSTHSIDVHAGSLKILLHVLERHGERLCYSWPNILEMLRSVADAPEKDLVSLGFQSLRVIMNDGISTIPADWFNVCVDVTGAYSAQKTDLNISLTAISLLWTTTDLIAKGLHHGSSEETETVPDTSSALKQMDDTRIEEKQQNSSTKVAEQAAIKGEMERENLLFSIFSLLLNLGADERPEVRNAAVRTFFQILGNQGQKLSESMWEDCIWNYVFPTLDRASHMAATSSKDEWRGKKLGTRGGKAIHMLIHHSRNTSQKQWDETLVLVFGGIARILRLFFPFLQNLSKFWSGWETLLHFVEGSILNGSKEVSLAAIGCLQTTVLSHCQKGTLPMSYFTSVFDVYELVLQNSPTYAENAVGKVKQEILHGLGELYMQAQMMFDNEMYTRLLVIINMATKQALLSDENFEIESGNVPPVLRTVLEILPSLCPREQNPSNWLLLMREFLHYLPRQESRLRNEGNVANHAIRGDLTPALEDSKMKTRLETPNGTALISPNKVEGRSSGYGLTVVKTTEAPSFLFAEKLVPVLVDLFLRVPDVEKYIIYPEIIQSIGRCMTTRRDNADGALWRIGVEAFHHILIDDFCRWTNSETDSVISRPARLQVWKEIADVYEAFLVGYCGRALSSSSPSDAALNADECLEMTILNFLGDNILKSPMDAPKDIVHKLVSTLDCCASRTSSLPIKTVECLPPHCGLFSLTCLQKLFSLSSYHDAAEEWNVTRCEVSQISIMMLMTSCEYILCRYVIDENNLGENPLPRVRVDEIIYILEELANLRIHPDTASSIPLKICSRSGLGDCMDGVIQSPHLLVLYPSFSEIIISREGRVRELVLVLLRLVASELNLQKLNSFVDNRNS